MRAITQDVYGGPEVLHEAQLDKPEPGPSEVLIRVRAAGVNPTDWKHRAGQGFLSQPPRILGWDVSGVVEDIGTGVTIHKPGDEVFGMLPYPFGLGSHAEYVTGPARAFVPKPEGIDHVQAGAIPLAALTAWQALNDTANLQSGQKILIHAAAGGVGHLAVQIAKAKGAHVIATASKSKHEFLTKLGVDELVDYTEVDFTEAVSDVDVVLDPIAADYRSRSLQVLRKGGILVSILPYDREELVAEAEQLGVRAELMLVEADQAGMQAVRDLVVAGKLRAEIADTFPLAEAAEAHTRGETGRTQGKLVLTID
ncbi:NADP-dependent oxidoreductase [Saccharopolyspora flava]|nr:NADP-dependent oxidoreductase [Saccharopolyspora flava]